MGLGLKIPCLFRVAIPVGDDEELEDEEEGGWMIGLREAGPIEKGEEGRGCVRQAQLRVGRRESTGLGLGWLGLD